MRYDLRVARPRRRSIRLWEYDYRANGAYFITICSHNRLPLFGSILNGRVRLSPAGSTVREWWLEIPNHFPETHLDRFVVMPDHMHGIILIRRNEPLDAPDLDRVRHGVPQQPTSPRRSFGGALRGSLATILAGFKSTVTRRLKSDGFTAPIWQRNYYEHIIQNDDDLWAVRRYIVTNPKRPQGRPKRM